MFEIIEYIKRSKVLINGCISNYVNKNLEIGDIVSFCNVDLMKFRSDFLKRLRVLGFIFNTPRYLFISYKLFFIFMERQPCDRSEEHTSELQSLMRISYAVFCLKKKNINRTNTG